MRTNVFKRKSVWPKSTFQMWNLILKKGNEKLVYIYDVLNLYIITKY